MEKQRILVPYDGSRHARQALLAKAYPARLRIIYIMEAMPWESGNDTTPGELMRFPSTRFLTA